MLSWIFRHRQRLAAIYGQAHGPLQLGPKQVEPLAQAPRAGRGPVPGLLTRRGKTVELRPMPPRVR